MQFRVDWLEGEFCSKATLSTTKNTVGLAILYAAEHYSFVMTDHIDLTNVWRQYPEVQQLVDEAPAIGRGMEKCTTVGQILVLNCSLPLQGRPLLWSTLTSLDTHEPQTFVCCMYLLLKEAERLHGSDVGLIFMGNLNAQPADGVGTLALQGQMTRDVLDWCLGASWNRTETKEEQEDEWFSPPVQDIPDKNDRYPGQDLVHNLQLSSACAPAPPALCCDHWDHCDLNRPLGPLGPLCLIRRALFGWMYGCNSPVPRGASELPVW